MQVPEKLALIGGGILISSTLIFSLKGQAAQLLPKVGHNIDSVYQDLTNTQAEHGGLPFNEAYQNAQKQNWRTGTWGSSKYYIDDHMNMHIGAGTLDHTLYDTVGDQIAHNLNTVNLDENVQAPQNSDNLFRGSRSHYDNVDAATATNMDKNNSISAINGLDRLNTSGVTSMNDMFYRNYSLSNPLDVGDWNVSQVTDMRGLFGATNVPTVNVQNWDVGKVVEFGWMFSFNPSLTHLDLSSFHSNNLHGGTTSMFSSDTGLKDLNLSNFNTTLSQGDMGYMFGGSADWDKTTDSLSKLTLGDQTLLKTNQGLSGNWKNGNQTLSGSELTSSGLNGEPVHPGTWIKQ